MTVNEVLNNAVIVNFCNLQAWSQELSTFLVNSTIEISMEIQINYSKLIAMDSYKQWLDTAGGELLIAEYLHAKTHNEIERIFLALTMEYNPKFTYDRTIHETNKGSNTNLYSGNDTEVLSGTDTYREYESINDSHEDKSNTSTNSSNTYDSADAQGLRITDKNEIQYETEDERIIDYTGSTIYGKNKTTTYGKNLQTVFGRGVDTTIVGTNGIYPYPELIKKEYDLRMKHKLFNTIIMLLVDAVSAGFWELDEEDEEK